MKVMMLRRPDGHYKLPDLGKYAVSRIVCWRSRAVEEKLGRLVDGGLIAGLPTTSFRAAPGVPKTLRADNLGSDDVMGRYGENVVGGVSIDKGAKAFDCKGQTRTNTHTHTHKEKAPRSSVILCKASRWHDGRSERCGCFSRFLGCEALRCVCVARRCSALRRRAVRNTGETGTSQTEQISELGRAGSRGQGCWSVQCLQRMQE